MLHYLLILSIVLITNVICDNQTYFVYFRIQTCSGAKQYDYCREKYNVNDCIYVDGGFFNKEYVFCNIRGFEDYRNQIRRFDKNGTQNSTCLCHTTVSYGSRIVGPTCMDPNTVYLTTQRYYPAPGEKNYTSEDFCGYIPDPKPKPKPDTDPSQQTNLGLILGLVGGGALLFVVVVIVCKYQKRKAANQQQYQKFQNQQPITQ